MNTYRRPLLALLFMLLLGSGAAALAAWAAQPVGASSRIALGALPVGTGTPVCGPSWGVVPSPSNGTAGNLLSSVAVVSVNDVWAVGAYSNTASVSQNLIERWDGTGWTVVPSPNVGSGDNYLEGVSAVSSGNVWAVGYYYNGAASQTLI